MRAKAARSAGGASSPRRAASRPRSAEDAPEEGPAPAGHTPARSARAAAPCKLDGPPDEGKSGPGGWVLLFEPRLNLNGDSLVPHLAGWRRERMREGVRHPWRVDPLRQTLEV
jgi:hypothetical protein